MSTLRNKFIVCSDIHTYYSNKVGAAHRLMTLYRAEKANGADIHTCGDFAVSTGGMFNSRYTTYWIEHIKVLLDEWSALGGLITAGNHDSGENFGANTKTVDIVDSGITYTPDQYWKLRTGADDDLLIQRWINDGKDLLLSISENGGAATAFSSSTIARVKDIITNNSDKRVFVFIHYPTWYQVDTTDGTYTKTENETTTSYTLKKNAFATRYGTGQTGSWPSSIGPYPQPTDFLLWLSQQPNVVIFSGHTHNDWRLQEEELEYTVNSAVYKGGKFPNIKYYHVPNGAYMINLPSLRYRTQDAYVEIYDDKVVVKARQGVYSSDSSPVAGAIDPMADNSTWSFQEMGDSYVYTIPLAESGTTAPEIYTITASLTNCTAAASNPSSIEENSTATLYFTANSGYTLPTTISVTGASYTWDPTTGALALSNPTGNVSIAIIANIITYAISATLSHCTAVASNPTTINANDTANLQFSASTGYNLPPTITVSGATYNWNAATGILALSNPTSNVSIGITATKISYSIQTSLTGCVGNSSNATSIEYGGTAELTFTASSGYTLPDTVTVSGATSSWDKSIGKLTISNPTGVISVTITAVEESTSIGSNIPIYTASGTQITGLDELWTHSGIHPTHIYDKSRVEIIFE